MQAGFLDASRKPTVCHGASNLRTLSFILPSTVYDSPVKRSLLPLTAGGLEPTDVRLGDGVPLLKKNQEQKEKYFMLKMVHKLGLQITAKSLKTLLIMLQYSIDMNY